MSSLFWAAQKLRFPEDDDAEFALAIAPESDQSLMDQMISLYRKTIEAFSSYLERVTEAELKGNIPSPFGDGEMILQEWLGINIHHTIGHVAQALRLQGLYLRNNISKK